MIKVSRLDGSGFLVNALHIETVEATPDTVITLYSGKKLVVREKLDSIAEQVMAYHQKVGSARPHMLPREEEEDHA